MNSLNADPFTEQVPAPSAGKLQGRPASPTQEGPAEPGVSGGTIAEFHNGKRSMWVWGSEAEGGMWAHHQPDRPPGPTGSSQGPSAPLRQDVPLFADGDTASSFPSTAQLPRMSAVV